DLATRRPDLDAQLAVALRQRDDALVELRQTEKDLNEEPDPVDVASLTRIAGAIAEAGDLEQRLQEDSVQLESLRSSVALLATGLEQPTDDPVSVAALPLPMKVTGRQFRETVADLDGPIATLAEQIPTKSVLDEARARREAGWQAVRASWLEENDEPGRDFNSTKPLPEAFEESQRLSDDAADGLRRDAERVATKVQLAAAAERLRRAADE